MVDLRKESKACRRAGHERRRVLREGESLRVAAPEPFTPDSASSMEQVQAPAHATHSCHHPAYSIATSRGAFTPDCALLLHVHLPELHASIAYDQLRRPNVLRSRSFAVFVFAAQVQGFVCRAGVPLLVMSRQWSRVRTTSVLGQRSVHKLRHGEHAHCLVLDAPASYACRSCYVAAQVAGKRFERSLHTLQRQEHPPCAECSGCFKARHGVEAAVYHGAPSLL